MTFSSENPCRYRKIIVTLRQTLNLKNMANPAESKDFFSQKQLAPDKEFKGEGIDECIVRAVSVFAMIEDAKRLLKLPKFKNANIAMVELKPQDGKIKKTFKKSHYSWWRSKSFDVNKAKIV